MTGCCVPLCSGSTAKGLRCFRFPRDPARRKKWEALAKRDKWTATGNSKICELHFEHDQFESGRQDGRRLLKKTAIPTLFSFRRNTALTPTVRHAAMPSKIAGHIVAGPSGVAHSPDVTCSQETQASVSTAATATQCTVQFLSSSQCQTEEEVPGSQVDGSPAGASFREFPARHHSVNKVEGAEGQQVNDVRSSQFSNTWELQNNHEGIYLRRKLHSNRSCQQASHTKNNFTNTDAGKKTHICRIFRKMPGRTASSSTKKCAPARRPTCKEPFERDLHRVSVISDRSPASTSAVSIGKVLIEKGLLSDMPRRSAMSVRKLLLDKGLLSDLSECTPAKSPMSVRKLLLDNGLLADTRDCTRVKNPMSALSIRKILLEKGHLSDTTCFTAVSNPKSPVSVRKLLLEKKLLSNKSDCKSAKNQMSVASVGTPSGYS
ncbi:uncharacterized protein LOC144158197 isoform X1 [Haemaphysalis longicornis]